MFYKITLMQHNYFDPTKLFSNLYLTKYLDTSSKSFFPCRINRLHAREKNNLRADSAKNKEHRILFAGLPVEKSTAREAQFTEIINTVSMVQVERVTYLAEIKARVPSCMFNVQCMYDENESSRAEKESLNNAKFDVKAV